MLGNSGSCCPGCCCTGSPEQGNCLNEIGTSDLLHSTRAGGKGCYTEQLKRVQAIQATYPAQRSGPAPDTTHTRRLTRPCKKPPGRLAWAAWSRSSSPMAGCGSLLLAISRGAWSLAPLHQCFRTRASHIRKCGAPVDGKQLAVDTAIVSPLTANGVARSLPALSLCRRHGAEKRQLTPSLLATPVAALWLSGVLRPQSLCVCWPTPKLVLPQPCCGLLCAYVHRWSGLLAAAASLPFAESLACLPSRGLSNLDGPGPDISDLLAGVRDAPDVSRLPAR